MRACVRACVCVRGNLFIMQGSYRSWKTWKVMEFDNLDSRPGKSWNFCPDPGKSWNLMLANMYPAELPTVLDCPKYMRENMLNYGKISIYYDVQCFRESR